MASRYSGPLGKAFSGDRDMAMSLQSRARVLVQMLFDKIKADPFKGKGSMHRQWNMEDGSIVHAYVNTLGAWPIVRTWIESPIGGGGGGLPASWYFAILEHGALQLAPRSDDYLPLSVYTGSAVKSYYINSVNLVSRGRGDYYLSEIYAEPTPIGGQVDRLLQQLEAERFYNLSITTPPITLSSLYTGLMRLAVQSWLSVGRSVASGAYVSTYGDLVLAPATNYAAPYTPVRPAYAGLIKHENVYWWVRINNSSVTFFKMVANPEVAIPQARQDDPRKSEVRRLASLMPSGYSVTVDVPEIAEIGGQPLAHGWHFNHKQPWKASIVTQRVSPGATSADWYRESTLATLSFAFNEAGEPSASLGIIESDVPFNIPAIHPIWYPSDAGYCTLETELGWRQCPDLAPLYCFYSQDNTLIVARIRNESTNLGTEKTGVFDEMPCGLGSVSRDSQIIGRTQSGGYALGGIDHSSGNISESHAIQTGTLDVRYTSTDYVESSPFSNVGPGCDGTGGSLNIDGDITAFLNVTFLRGGIFRDITSWSRSISNTYQSVIIPRDDAEAAYIIKKSSDKVYGKTQNIGYPAEGNPGQWVEMTIGGVFVRTVGPVTVDYVRKIRIEHASGTYQTDVTNFPDEESFDGSSAHLITSRGVFEADAPDGSVWENCLFGSQAYPCGICSGATVSLAYSSGGVFTTGGGNKQYLDTYSPDAGSSPRSLRWIGDA